ncbi:hypothetical protein AB0K60_30070 [Thermopolyspora sp. NPDC052614]|uniref:hypothetical protein n=1 Tax=Thermopolyspora sp. NPDC052614 TaxID=3155682 RepID=UPI003416A8C7
MILTVSPPPTPARAHRTASPSVRALSAGRLLPLLPAVLLALTACAGPAPAPRPSPPPGSSAYSGQGPLATASQLAFTDLHSRLTRRYEKPWDIQRHAIPPEARGGRVGGGRRVARHPDERDGQ